MASLITHTAPQVALGAGRAGSCLEHPTSGWPKETADVDLLFALLALERLDEFDPMSTPGHLLHWTTLVNYRVVFFI